MSRHKNKLALPAILIIAILVLVIYASVTAASSVGQQELVKLAAKPSLPSNETRLIYGETAPQGEETILWLASTSNLADPQPLATIQHRQGYPPTGSVSPDGKLVAIFIIPPGTSESSARIDGGEIWLVSSDGSNLERVISQVGFIGPWSPNSRWILYGKYAPIQQPADPRIPFRTEIYRVSVEDKSADILLSDEQSYGVQLLGWSPDGNHFYAALLQTSGEWLIQLQNAATAKLQETWALPPLGLVRSISLSPDGEQILAEHLLDDTDTLSIFSLKPGQRKVNPGDALASAPILGDRPVSPVSGRWNARGKDLWLYRAPQPGSRGKSEVKRAESNTIETQSLDEQAQQDTLLPAGWSPDGRWFLWQKYPRIFNTVLLQSSSSGQLIPVPVKKTENWITPFGWLDPSETGSGP